MNKQELQKFTVIIPTRERCDTLRSTLRTCISEDYDNLEIIVSDNFSQDRTKEVVKSFNDKRIKYVNPGKRISMSHNWEFALSHVREGYVMFLGDDDGILPGALAELNKIIAETGCEAITWKSAGYNWPTHINENARNILSIPLKNSLEKRDSKKMLNVVIHFRAGYDALPMVYRGFVRYDTIKRAMDKSGKFFHSMVPDVYSGIAIACVTETYHYSSKPYTIEGVSHHSTGAATFTTTKNKMSEKKFLSEENIPFHRKMVAYVPSFPILVAESMLQVQEFMPSARQFRIDIKDVMSMAAANAANTTESQYSLVIDTIKQIGQINGLEPHALKVISQNKNIPLRAIKPVLGKNIFLGSLLVDASEFGAKNVYEVSLLCRHLLAAEKIKYYSIGNVLRATIGLLRREINKRAGLSPKSMLSSLGIIKRVLLKK